MTPAEALPRFAYFAQTIVPQSVPSDGILSRTLHADDRVKIIQFTFAAGQELSAHTAPMPAILYFQEGEADLTLGGEAREAKAGTLVHMEPQLVHGVKARTQTTMLLMMLKNPRT